MSKLTRLVPLALTTFLAGCAVGPNYVAPTPAAVTRFSASTAAPVTTSPPPTQWWSHFHDPVLNQLVTDALARNHELRLAHARLAEARALRRGSLWDFAPTGSADAMVQRGRPSETETRTVTPPVSETWSAGFDASWELDLFGRTRRRTEVATAEVGATAAMLRDVQVAVIAEVAASYFALRGSEGSFMLVREQLVLLRESHALTELRVAAGRGTPLDTARTESLLRETEALLPLLERDSHTQRHRLAVLLGRTPGDLDLAPASLTSAPTDAVAIGSPADLLRRRPDVQHAERTLAAATSHIGVSTAALFPAVSLNGVFRFVGLSSSDLGDAGTRSWAVAPTLQWHVLDYGRLRAQLTASRARADGALAHYEATVLRALEDTENALARYRAALARGDSLDARRAAADRARTLALRQYEAGATDPLARLDAERTALAAGRDALSAHTERHLALVALYKALGGT
ncbi:MAG: efflux transporter outer membrane subunit [Opitutaceae bacterium]|nr:efflux transporter outer membrane subunit [Opitutaceae bacterium]